MSIDQSTDLTEEICLEHAVADDRVEVVAQPQRLGWARNVNFLLERVDTEYFFIYPHDDVLASRYTERLLTALRARPDAASVQCDVLNVDGSGGAFKSRGRAHEGSVSQRLIASLVDPSFGSPLRSLIRRAAVGDELRFAQGSHRGFQAHVPFRARLFAAGPALHVPDVLYWRDHGRRSGVGHSWSETSITDVIVDQQTNAAECLRLIDNCRVSADERVAMQFALYVNLLSAMREFEANRPGSPLTAPSAISPVFDYGTIPPAIKQQPDNVRRWIFHGYGQLVRAESKHYLRSGDFRSAASRLRSLRVREATVAAAMVGARRFRTLASKRRAVVERSDVPTELLMPGS